MEPKKGRGNIYQEQEQKRSLAASHLWYFSATGLSLAHAPNTTVVEVMRRGTIAPVCPIIGTVLGSWVSCAPY